MSIRPDRLSVVIVDDHEISHRGAAEVLKNDPDHRFDVVTSFRRIAELTAKTAGVVYNVCVLDLFGVGSNEEINQLLRTRPVVACTSSTDWQVRVSAWASGARAVLGKEVYGPPLAQAVWDAVHVPLDIKPHVAQALLDASDVQALHLTVRQHGLLSDVANGMPRLKVMQEAGVDSAGLDEEVLRIRALCEKAGFGRVVLPASALPGPDGSEAAYAQLTAIYRNLTLAQQRMVRLHADGLSEAEIAAQILLALTTVRNHLAGALHRSGINRADAETKVWFALAVTGQLRDPERVLARIEALRERWPWPS